MKQANENNKHMQNITEDIRQGSFKRAYLLCGEERYLRKQYTKRLQNAMCNEGDTMNTHFYDGKNLPIGEIIDLAETMPFLAERRVIFISNSELFKSGGEQLAEYLSSPNESTYFVFTEETVDKRCKLYKTVQSKGYAAEFTEQDEDTLKRWIAQTLKQENKKITENTARLFLERTGTDMENIQMELEKLICYCMDKEVVTSEDVDAICTTRIHNHIFGMIDAIADKQQKKTLMLYYDLLALREPPMRILILIARQFNQLLQIKELQQIGYDSKAIGEKTKLAPFIVKKCAAQAGRFKASDLKKALVQCVEMEEAIKSGRLNDNISVEMLILSIV